MHLENLTPVLFDGWEPVIEGSFLLLGIPFGHIFLFSVLINQVEASSNTKKIMFVGIGIFVISFLLIIIKNIAVLGMKNIGIISFPSFAASGLINIGGFLRSIEIFIAIYYLINSLFLIIISTYFALKGIQKLFDLDNSRKLATPVGFMTLAILVTLFKDSGNINTFYKIIPYYFFLFEVILPVIVYVFSEIKFQKIHRNNHIKSRYKLRSKKV